MGSLHSLSSPQSVMMSMKKLLITLLISFPFESNFTSSNTYNNDTIRRKRYAIFPEGSTFTIAICVTLKLLTPDYDIFTEAVNWALTYDLPSNVEDYEKSLYDNGGSVSSLPPVIVRRKRSSFFRKLELLMDSKGLNGRACILKTLCEVTNVLPSDGFLELIVKTLFQMPMAKVQPNEPPEHFLYDTAYRIGTNTVDSCAEIYSSCNISLLQVFLNLQPAAEF